MNLCVLTVAAHLVQQHSEEGVQLANHIIWKCQILWFGAMLAFQSSKPQDSDRLNAQLLILPLRPLLLLAQAIVRTISEPCTVSSFFTIP